MANVRRLVQEDAEALGALRRESLEAYPLHFGAAPEQDRFRDPAAVLAALSDTHERAILGAFEGERLVGMAGVYRQPALKARHTAAIWGMYVQAAARGRGLGRALLRAAVDEARAWEGVLQVQLGAAEGAAAARALYESEGFRVWGIEPRALCWEGRFSAEVHFHLPLDGA